METARRSRTAPGWKSKARVSLTTSSSRKRSNSNSSRAPCALRAPSAPCAPRSRRDEISRTQRRRLSGHAAETIECDANAIGSRPQEPPRPPRKVKRLERSRGGVFGVWLVFENERVAAAQIAACVERRLEMHTHPIRHRPFRLRLAIAIHPTNAIVGHVERPVRANGEVPRHPASVAQRVVLPPPCVNAMADLVINPLVVPAPAFVHPPQRVLRPAHMTAVGCLVLMLVAESRPERRGADDEVEYVDGCGWNLGRSGRCLGGAGDRQHTDQGQN